MGSVYSRGYICDSSKPPDAAYPCSAGAFPNASDSTTLQGQCSLINEISKHIYGSGAGAGLELGRHSAA